MDGYREGAVDERECSEALFESHEAYTRWRIFGAACGGLMIGGLVTGFTLDFWHRSERNQNRDPIKTPANPDNGEGVPYLSPRVPQVPRVIVDPPVTPIEIPVGVDVDADSLVPIDWDTSSSS